MDVLVLGASTLEDPCIDRVGAALARRGLQLLRLDTARYPVELRISARPDGIRLHTSDGSFDLERLRSVWTRQVDIGAAVAERIATGFCEAALHQAGIGLWSALDVLPARFVDRPERLKAVPEQVRQLQLARQAGLRIPATRVTNDPEDALSFIRAQPEGCVVKLLHSSSVDLVDAEGRSRPVRTRRIDLDEAPAIRESLPLCPMIFQERLPKAREYRLTAVGRRLFAASIDSRGSKRGAEDWRADPSLVRAFRAATLPAAVEAAVHRLLDRIGLEFATIDLIERPDGDFVFLELNSISYYDFVEDAAGLPISEALAALLAHEAPCRSDAS